MADHLIVSNMLNESENILPVNVPGKFDFLLAINQNGRMHFRKRFSIAFTGSNWYTEPLL